VLHREGEGLDQGRREAHVKQSKMAEEERHSYDAIDKQAATFESYLCSPENSMTQLNALSTTPVSMKTA
jgi:hypothetical protein